MEPGEYGGESAVDTRSCHGETYCTVDTQAPGASGAEILACFARWCSQTRAADLHFRYTLQLNKIARIRKRIGSYA